MWKKTIKVSYVRERFKRRQTKIAPFEKDAKIYEQIHRRLEIAIDKLSIGFRWKVCLLNKSKSWQKQSRQMKISLSR